VNDDLLKKICCPVCKSSVKCTDGEVKCLNDRCAQIYFIVNDIPYLIRDETDFLGYLKMERIRDGIC